MERKRCINVFEATIKFVETVKEEDVVGMLTEKVYNEYKTFCQREGSPFDSKWSLTSVFGRKRLIGTTVRWVDGSSQRVYCKIEFYDDNFKKKEKQDFKRIRI